MEAISDDEHDWLTVHRVRLKAERKGIENPMPVPDGALVWRFSPDWVYGENGFPTWSSDIWGGFAVHGSRAAAEAAFAAGDGYLPFAADIVESWRALAVPIRHHGTVLWRAEKETDSALRVARSDPGGPLMIITSAGFDGRGPEKMPQLLDFFKSLEAVLIHYRALPENRRATIFPGGVVDGRDGLTLSIWRDMPGMMASAYRTGTHARVMAEHKAVPKADRTSFTRLRVLASSGSWDGDPLAGAA